MSWRYSNIIVIFCFILNYIICDDLIIPPSASDFSENQSIKTESVDYSKKAKDFSGLYRPPVSGSEFYAGAWLAPKRRLLSSTESISKIVNLEGASFHLVLTGPVLMTRDYLDYEVIHLSSTTNQFPELDNEILQNELIHRMEKTVEALKIDDLSTFVHRYRDKKILEQTVVVIPFSSEPASQHNSNDKMKRFSDRLRILYLQATVWSVFRVFPKIVIVCGYKDQLQMVKDLNLPIWKYADLSEGLKSRYFLPRESLLYVISKLKQNHSEPSTLEEDRQWENTEYIYYTEADQILHSRHLPNIIHNLDRLKGKVALVPHRMQTIALPKTFAHINKEYVWDTQRDIWHPSKSLALRQAELIIEDPVVPQGSCCDDGRFRFGDCGNWWYNCKLYGLHNYTQWVRFGENGFTLPFGTEHQAKCKYTKTKILCPIPTDCPRKSPRTESEMCGEMQNTVYIPSVQKSK